MPVVCRLAGETCGRPHTYGVLCCSWTGAGSAQDGNSQRSTRIHLAGTDMNHFHDPNCIFCRIIGGGEDRGNVFWEDDIAIGLRDHRPLKDGHALLIPRAHFATIKDLPSDLIGPLFRRAAELNRAVEVAFDADGSFSAYNTHVSQSVDHFHLHVVPRTFGDRLFSGGKWIRKSIKDAEKHRARRDALGDAMRSLIGQRSTS